MRRPPADEDRGPRRPAPCVCPACAARCAAAVEREPPRDCREAAEARRAGRRR